MPIDVTDQTFEEQVLKAAGPVLVDFWAPWCGPCRHVGPVIAEIEEELGGALTVAKVNVDECPMAAGTFRVQSIPAMWLFDKGEALGQVVGAQPKDRLMQFISHHLKSLGVEALSPADVELARDDMGATLVDIRPAVDYDRGHLPGALSICIDPDDIDAADLPAALADLRDERLIVYCRGGQHSTALARRLLKEGYASVSVIEDGVFGWEVSDRRLVTD